jgi:hypothetical protein
LVRLLEAYSEGRDVDVPEWNPDIPLPQFVRWAADDLKAVLPGSAHATAANRFLSGTEHVAVE